MGNCSMKRPVKVLEVSSYGHHHQRREQGRKIGKKAKDSNKSQRKVFSQNEQLMRQWMVYSNTSEKLMEAKSLASSAFMIHFKHEDIRMPLDQYLDSFAEVHRSFPDFTLAYKNLKEISPGTVTAECVQARGTHTGAPFGFGPFPAIPATNIRVVDAPIHVTATIRNGKIDKFVCDSGGRPSGPAHFYTQLGGLVI